MAAASKGSHTMNECLTAAAQDGSARPPRARAASADYRLLKMIGLECGSLRRLRSESDK